MIAISMRFPSGRLHATPWGYHVNEGVVEYPPSYFRLLRSLIAVRRRACQDLVTEEQLKNIVTALRQPPHYCLPPISVGHTRHYDQENSGIKFIDTFMSIRPEDEVIWGWPGSQIDAGDLTALKILLLGLGTFGRAESWCEARVLSPEETNLLEEDNGWANSRPLDENQPFSSEKTIRLLAPDPLLDGAELIKVLEIDTSTMRKSKQIVPPGTRWITYLQPDGILRQPTGSIQQRRKVSKQYTIARFALSSNVLPHVTDALPFAEQVRRALIRNRVDTSHSEVILGKQINGDPLQGHLHAHYLATDENQDGRLDHLTIIAPIGFDQGDIDAIGAMRTIFRRGNESDVNLVLTGLGSKEEISQLTPFRSARIWRSFTPFSLPRFANRGAGKVPRPRDLPETQLMRELSLRGLPDPISIKRIEGYQCSGRPVIRWLDFHSRRFNGSEGHGLAGFELTFDQPIDGPLSLGFACHFGLGLFMPVK
jgi:CRISPR-associated protein Csb2